MCKGNFVLIFVFLSSFLLLFSSPTKAEIQVSLQEFYEENASWTLDTSAMIYEVYSDYFNEVNIGGSNQKVQMDYDRDNIRHRYDVYYGEVIDNRRFLIAFNKAFPLDYIKDNVSVVVGINQNNYYEVSQQPAYQSWFQNMIKYSSPLLWLGSTVGEKLFPEKNVVQLNNLEGRWYPVSSKTDVGILLNNSGKISTSDYDEIASSGSDYLDKLNFDEYYYFLVDVENKNTEKTEVYLNIRYPQTFNNSKYSSVIQEDTGTSFNFDKQDAVVRIQTGLPESQIQNTLGFTDTITEVIYNFMSLISQIFELLLNFLILTAFLGIVARLVDLFMYLLEQVRTHEI